MVRMTDPSSGESSSKGYTVPPARRTPQESRQARDHDAGYQRIPMHLVGDLDVDVHMALLISAERHSRWQPFRFRRCPRSAGLLRRCAS